MNFDDSRNEAFEFRNPSLNTYLNRDALSELGLSALSGGARGAGAMGEHMFLCDMGLEESDINVLLLYMYMYGVVCLGDITYYAGYVGKRLSTNIGRMIKRELCSELTGDRVSSKSHKSYKSGKFYIANYDSVICKMFLNQGIKPFLDITRSLPITDKMLPHTYGTGLSVMMVNLYCHLRDCSVRRVLFETSLSKNNTYKYVKKFSADVTVDAIADIVLPNGIERTLNIEFDTGTENFGMLAEKFTNYYSTAAYSGEPGNSAFYTQTVVFSYNDISVKANSLRNLSPFLDYFRFYVRCGVMALCDIGALYGGSMPVYDSIAGCDVSTYLDADKVLRFNSKYNKKCAEIGDGNLCMAVGMIIRETLPGYYGYLVEQGAEGVQAIIRFLAEPGINIKENIVSDYFELSDYCDAFGNTACSFFTIDNMRNVLYSYLGHDGKCYNSSDSDVFSCSELGILERKAYNRRQYELAFARHIGIASKVLQYSEGKTSVVDGRLVCEEEPDYGDMVRVSALYSGYQVYTAPTHLLNNYLSTIIGKDETYFTTDKAIGYVSSYIYRRYSARKIAVSQELHLNSILGHARLRDCHVDVKRKYIYSVSDASVETSSLVRSGMLQHYYSPTANGNSGYHLVNILLVRSFTEMHKIVKIVFKDHLEFINDSDSSTVFAFHPELDFGFRSASPVFYTVTAKGKIIETDI